MQLSRNDLRRSLCACRATSSDTVKRALCAFVQHKGKEIQRKSQKRSPKDFSKAFELFVVSENVETTRVRTTNSPEKNPSCFSWDFDHSFSPGVSRRKARLRDRSLPGDFLPQCSGKIPRGFRCPKWQMSFKVVTQKHQKTHKNTPKCIRIYPNLSHEFIPCLFCIFLGFVLVLVLVGFSEKGLTLPQRFWESRIIQHSKILGLHLISCCQLWNSKSSGLRLKSVFVFVFSSKLAVSLKVADARRLIESVCGKRSGEDEETHMKSILKALYSLSTWNKVSILHILALSHIHTA